MPALAVPGDDLGTLGFSMEDKKRFLGFQLPPLYPWAPESMSPRQHVPKIRDHTRPTSASLNGHSTGGSTGSELAADSVFLSPRSSLSSDEMPGDKGLPLKYLSESPAAKSKKPETKPALFPRTSPNTSPKHSLKLKRSVSASSPKKMVDAAVQTSDDYPIAQGAPMLTLCKEMVNMTLDRLKGCSARDNLVDGILSSCESIKVAVVSILEAFTQAQVVGQSPATFADSEVVRVTSMQLVASLELLVSHTSLWATSFVNVDLPSIHELSDCIDVTVKELATELLAFLQGCENDLDEQAEDCSTRVMELLYELVRYCGELAVATETSPSMLQHSPRETLEDLISMRVKDEDLIRIKVSSDLKQSFLGGGDNFVERCLQGAVRCIQDCEEQAQAFTAQLETEYHDQNAGSEEVLKHVYIAVATAKLLVLKCQVVQVELNACMKEECARPDDYYYRYFQRCLALISHVNVLVDSVTLLTGAAEPLSYEAEGGALRKTCRCAEMIQRAALKLVGDSASDEISCSATSSVTNSFISSLTDYKSLKAQHSQTSILSDVQFEQLDQSGNDVRHATEALIEITRKHMPASNGGEGRIKRMLPVTPGGRPVVRCQSARSSERKRLSRNMSLIESTPSNGI